jgi:hypothetical protein
MSTRRVQEEHQNLQGIWLQEDEVCHHNEVCRVNWWERFYGNILEHFPVITNRVFNLSICYEYNSQCPSRLTVQVRRLKMRKKLKLGSDGGDCSSMEWKCRFVNAYGGIWCNVSLLEVWSPTVSSVLLRLAGNWLHVFTFNLLHEEIL